MTDTAATAVAPSEADELALAATSIFGGSSNSFKSRSGKMVIIRPATMAQFAPTLRFFNAILGSMDTGAIALLVDMIADAQKQAISEGKDPTSLDVQVLTSRVESAEISAEDLVRKVFSGADILTGLLAAAADQLPDLVEAFTNVSKVEFNSMDPDEGIILAVGIFTANYDFFSRRLPPIFRAFAQSKAANSPLAGAVASVSTSAKRAIKRRR